MLLNPQRIATREKLILAGLYLSKYDSLGLRKLGFESFVEAFNVIGYALGSKPMSIKNYRDEFDPLFPNKRQGWHKRPRREYCIEIYKKYKGFKDEAKGLTGERHRHRYEFNDEFTKDYESHGMTKSPFWS